MRVRDLVKRKPALITVQPADELRRAIQLLAVNHIGGLPVMGPDGTPVGFLAERDVVRAAYERPHSYEHLRVSDLMRPALLCDADDSPEEAMQQMTSQRYRHLLVRDDGRIIGLISLGDLIKHRLEQLETETGVLRDYVAAHRAVR